MNPDYQNKKLPIVLTREWGDLFPRDADKDAVDLVQKMLRYKPNDRINLYQALCHPLFDELREDGLLLPNGNCIPDLFNFSDQEIIAMETEENREILIPKWYDPIESPGQHIVTEEQIEELHQMFKKNGLE